MQQNDTTLINAQASADSLPVAKKAHQLTPEEVISWLPKDATPEQMDSMVQLYIKPSPIRWSTQPDTLHLPGQTKGKSFRDISLPQYYKESFFSQNSFFHPELSGGRLGVAGDPVPYAIANDNFFTSLLLGCFILAAVAFSQSHKFIKRQAHNFFHVQRGDVTTITETANELRFQFFLGLQTCLLFSLCFYLYQSNLAENIYIVEPYQIIAIFTGVFAAYFLIKAALYWITSWVFFDLKRNAQWAKSYLFIVSVMGVALFPMVILQAFFEFHVQSLAIYTLLVIILAKILSLYKIYSIFFSKNGHFLQIILYFCALEITPLLSLWGVLSIINSYLRVNF